jgi:hypothetical protein
MKNTIKYFKSIKLDLEALKKGRNKLLASESDYKEGSPWHEIVEMIPKYRQ